MQNHTEKTSETIENTFLRDRYLQERYVFVSNIYTALNKAVEIINDSFPGKIFFMTIGGSVSNGSLAYRRIKSPNLNTDIDFYFGGNSLVETCLHEASLIITRAVKDEGLIPDGLLNGTRLDYALQLDNLENHIENEDFDMLALPFEASIGNSAYARQKVFEYVVSLPHPQAIWEKIVHYQHQSLSMHHSSLGELNNEIMNDFLPRKIEKWGLPLNIGEYRN
jgi:hypothetical protein